MRLPHDEADYDYDDVGIDEDDEDDGRDYDDVNDDDC